MATDTDTLTQAQTAREALEARKGAEPVVLDVRGLSGVTDFYVIASGSSPPHLKALHAEVSRRMKAAGHARFGSAGKPDTGWMVLDYLGVVVHVFTPDKRDYYALEDLWSDAPRV